MCAFRSHVGSMLKSQDCVCVCSVCRFSIALRQPLNNPSTSASRKVSPCATQLTRLPLEVALGHYSKANRACVASEFKEIPCQRPQHNQTTQGWRLRLSLQSQPRIPIRRSPRELYWNVPVAMQSMPVQEHGETHNEQTSQQGMLELQETQGQQPSQGTTAERQLQRQLQQRNGSKVEAV